MKESIKAAYEELVEWADLIFARAQEQMGSRIKCQVGCTDCCYAVFGLFPVEAVYLREKFADLPVEEQQAALARAAVAEEQLRELERKLARHQSDPSMQGRIMARERVRCPLLNNEGQCVLYPFRPLTCRVYGMPVTIQGRAQVCWKADFEAGERYQAFNLDTAYRQLYHLSLELLGDEERAGLLLSLPLVLRVSVEDLLAGKWS
ncbi:YkgJ family cysteine cluster protein [Desulfothermobacter acidiphilus]|uniref:YkgJ family cysteine cluster protein n=1 Tax=Desulfothermobacter acidiphilus TaxID=1938353 RepID=UPI003F8B1DE8